DGGDLVAGPAVGAVEALPLGLPGQAAPLPGGDQQRVVHRVRGGAAAQRQGRHGRQSHQLVAGGRGGHPPGEGGGQPAGDRDQRPRRQGEGQHRRDGDGEDQGG